uniref:Uncharacterized protein n=1 Tax=Oryza nivara TaxID=4536 RepID=A0A0E0ICS7_ORYNI
MSGSTSPKKRHVHLDASPSCMTSVVAKGELVGEVPNRLAVPPNHVARQGDLALLQLVVSSGSSSPEREGWGKGGVFTGEGFHADGEYAAFTKEERGVVEVQVIVTR